MKNYLYILCAFLLAFAGCTKDADVEPIAPAPDGNTQVVLTGFSGRGTRTGFGGAEDGAVPFLWSAGDYIWARNTRSEAIAEGGSQATFVFESLETADTYDVFYNLTGPRPPQVHPLLDARTGHRPFALRLDRPDRPTRAALPSDPGYGVQRLHRTAVQQFVRHLRHGERHDQSPQVTDSL